MIIRDLTDSDESPHCVYNEIVALRLAQTLHIPIADGALTLTPDGQTYASLELTASGLPLPDVATSRLDDVARLYPDEVAALIAFDIFIGNFDRGRNLKAVLQTPHVRLFRGFDHSHALLSTKGTLEDSLLALASDALILRFHPFFGRVTQGHLDVWAARIAMTPNVLIRECCVQGKPFRAVTTEMQQALADALIWRANVLPAIITAHRSLIGARP